jgi:lipoprotein-anchoring transpeptidase ErfK/SrfK
MADSLDLRQFSRREFLRFSSAALISVLALGRTSFAYAESGVQQDAATPLGRVTKKYKDLFDTPSENGKVIRELSLDEVLPITNSAIGSDETSNNRIWYELNGEGFIHSGVVQPVANQLNEKVTDIPASGLLSEVTVPFTDAVWDIQNPGESIRLYYSTTHWILGLKQDQAGGWWYELLEDFYQKSYFVNAAHMRVIPLNEISPLSPAVPADEKRIEVHLANQLVIAYEADTQVQLFRCSAGITKEGASLTPIGDFRTDYKRPSRHMIDGNDHHMNTFNLPGIPWISYLDVNGISFHGTYWHNNYGVPMSHGCINLPPASAKWIYRWTNPVVGYGEQKGYKMLGGTKVTIR